ncbi:MAG: hypothetical protein WD271_12155 [Acidimicrobiia bacterium]
MAERRRGAVGLAITLRLDPEDGRGVVGLHERVPEYALDPEQAPGDNNSAFREVDSLPLVFTPRELGGPGRSRETGVAKLTTYARRGRSTDRFAGV